MGQHDRRGMFALVIRSEELRLEPHGAAIVQALSVACRARGCDLVTMLATRSRQRELLDQLAASAVDGAVVCGPSLKDELACEISAAESRPLVILGRTRPDHHRAVVDIEYVESTARLVGHLLDTAGPRIAMIAGPPGRFDSEQRIDGNRLAHERRGLVADETKIVHGNFTRGGGYRLAHTVLDDAPDSVFAANDEMCLGVALAASERGLTIPVDLSLAGFDGSSEVRIDEPRLTTANQPFDQLANALVDALLAALQRDDSAPTILLEPNLHFGWSTQVETT